MEKYSGAKFSTVFLDNKVPIANKSHQLIKWFRKFYEIGMAPEYGYGSSGNLSFRHKRGFIIKSTKTYFNTIKPDELVFVEKFDLKNKTAYCYGKLEPSTELQMHYLIYKKRKNVNAIFHLHDYDVMGKASKLRLPITSVTSAGTEEIGYDVVKNLDNSKYVIMKGHGIVAVGRTMKESGGLILKYHKLAND